MQTLTITLAKQKKSDAKITDRIKTVEDAMNATGIMPDQLTLTVLSGNMDEDFNALSAFMKLTIVTRALNEEWIPDWSNGNQPKYYPWFDMSSGSGLSCGGCVDWDSDSIVGSRLCFKSRELAEYAGKQFIELYTQLFIIKNNNNGKA